MAEGPAEGGFLIQGLRRSTFMSRVSASHIQHEPITAPSLGKPSNLLFEKSNYRKGGVKSKDYCWLL